MLQSYVLVTVRMGAAAAAVEALRCLPGVRYADAVTGPYDIVVDLEATDVDVLGKLVQEYLQTVPGVVRTITCPVFHL
ncbi:MAG: Lrp/AsnC ligand binding domain-containing protein [Actinomycetota bacterium]